MYSSFKKLDLSRQTNLRVLRIDDEMKYGVVTRALPCLSKLEELRIRSRSLLQPAELLKIGEFIRSNPNMKSATLDIRSCAVYRDFLEAITASIKLMHLSLDIAVSSKGPNFTALCRFIENVERLPSLKLHCDKQLSCKQSAKTILNAVSKNRSLLLFELNGHRGLSTRATETISEVVASHPLLERWSFHKDSLKQSVMKPMAATLKVDAYHLMRRCRFLASCRHKFGKNILPFELLEKIFIDSLNKSDSWDPKKHRLIQRCLLSRKTIGKITRYFAFSAGSLYWACNRAEELID